MATITTYTAGDSTRSAAIKEDLLDIIENIDPVNNFFVSNLGKSAVTSTFHEWLEDNLPTVTAGSTFGNKAENFTPSWSNISGTIRKSNMTQIIASDFQVSRTQQLVEKAGINDRMAYEQDRAMKHWTNLAENSIMHSSLTSGNGTTARAMRGIKFQSSLTSMISVISLSETIFNTLMQNAFPFGIRYDTVVVPASYKSRISSWTAGSTKFTDVTDKKLVNLVDVYESDWGVVKIVPHRYAITGEIIFLQSDKVKLAYLDTPHFEEYAKTTDGMNGLIRGELTTEVRNFYGVGFYNGML